MGYSSGQNYFPVYLLSLSPFQNCHILGMGAAITCHWFTPLSEWAEQAKGQLMFGIALPTSYVTI